MAYYPRPSSSRAWSRTYRVPGRPIRLSCTSTLSLPSISTLHDLRDSDLTLRVRSGRLADALSLDFQVECV